MIILTPLSVAASCCSNKPIYGFPPIPPLPLPNRNRAMLQFLGGSQKMCSGLSRRNFLSAGSLCFGFGGFTLADLLRAEEAAGKKSSHKGLINIFLGGGPPHQDMWDIKTEAPSEIRGEFSPISTNVPGIDICEVFPQLAQRMDKAAIIRSVVGCKDRHESHQCMSGWFPDDLKALWSRWRDRRRRRPRLSAMRSATMAIGCCRCRMARGRWVRPTIAPRLGWDPLSRPGNCCGRARDACRKAASRASGRPWRVGERVRGICGRLPAGCRGRRGRACATALAPRAPCSARGWPSSGWGTCAKLGLSIRPSPRGVRALSCRARNVSSTPRRRDSPPASGRASAPRRRVHPWPPSRRRNRCHPCGGGNPAGCPSRRRRTDCLPPTCSRGA